MKICSHCGFKLLDNQRYCPKCGLPITTSNNQDKANLSHDENIENTARIEIPNFDEKEHNKKPVIIVSSIAIGISLLCVILVVLLIYNQNKTKVNTDNIDTINPVDTINNTDGNNTDDDDINSIDNDNTEKIDETIIIENTDETNNQGNTDNTVNNDDTSNENKTIINSEDSSTVDSYIKKYADRDFILPQSKTKKLTYSDLNSLSVEELFIARNEMFARYGYVFDDDSNLAKFFESKEWYSSNSNYSGDLHSEIEEDNCKLIRTVEFTKLSHDSCPDITSDYVFPNSSSSLLSSSDISSKNNWEIIIAINEIYARYGYSFSSTELNNYFENKSWYNNTHSNDITLNDIEDNNLKLLAEERERRTKNALMHDLGK